MSQQKKATTGGPLFYVGALIYIGFLILFAWQTILFVNWLFPDDQIEFRILMATCFDGMSLFWSLLDLFYHFATKATRTITRWGWGISFLLSLLATVFYLILSSVFRFHLVLGQDQVNIGYAITAVAVVFQVVMLTFFFYIEIVTRHPHQDEYISDANVQVTVLPTEPVVALAQTTTVKKKRLPRRQVVTAPLASQGANTTPGE